MSKAINRKLTIKPVKKSLAAAAVGSFRARSAAATVQPKVDQDHGVKASAVRNERFRLQSVKHS